MQSIEYGRGKNRSRHEIINDVLSNAVPGIKKTHIMFKCNLSFAQATLYVSELLESEMLEQVSFEDNADMLYVPTKKGRQYVMHFDILVSLLDGTLDPVHDRYMKRL